MIDNLEPKPNMWETNPRLKMLSLVFIFVFLFSGIGLVIFSVWSNQYRQQIYNETEQSLPKHEASKSVDQQVGVSDIANWQTYKNDQYGFEFKLPPRWQNFSIEQIRDNSYGEGGAVFLIGNLCDFSVYPNEAWKKFQKDDTTNKPIYITGNEKYIFGWGCGHDDYGVKGFELYDKAYDEKNFDAINSGKIMGPFNEFKTLILPTFKLTN